MRTVRWTIVFALAVVVVSGFLIGGNPVRSTVAQDDADDETAALETRVAELEATIVALEATVAANDAADEPEPPEIRDYPRNVLDFGEEGRINGWLIEIREVDFDAIEAIHENNEFV